jgi:gamma-glutamyl-gamma-aminobutyrate hydrolase PuuD
MPHIAISYRDEGHGKGAFYDHLTLRKMTGWTTKVALPGHLTTTMFSSYINYREGNEHYGLPDDANLPEVSLNFAKEAAFLFIPGYTRASDRAQQASHVHRLNFEKELIRKARYRGQPILAVCAGSWTLWEAFGGEVKPVQDHNYGGAMPRISKSKAKICNNKMIHDVETVEGSFVHHGMFGKTNQRKIAVNSVHWNAVNEATLNKNSNICVSARSKTNDLIAPKSRQSKKMNPEGCVEGFETIHGAPMIGVQWHPEACNPTTPHKGIFDALKTSGTAYKNRQKLNREFKKTWAEKAYSEQSFFKLNNNADDLLEVQEQLRTLAV